MVVVYVDMPLIISGDKVAFLDPQENVWRGESGRLFYLRELSGSDHVKPLHGISDFSQSTAHYHKTLFRFPLRNAASGLWDNAYTIKKLTSLSKLFESRSKVSSSFPSICPHH